MSPRPPAQRAAQPRLGSRDLALVVAVADHGSLRGAARALGQTVAALSKHLIQLEDRLEQPLFRRLTTGVVPTEAGARMVGAGRRILADMAALEGELRPEPQPEGLVTIGAGPFPAPFIAQSVAPMVRARWPGIQLEVQVGFPGDVVTGVEQGRLDIAVCHLDDRVLPASLRARLVQRLVPVCLVREGHPLLAEAAGGPIPAARLAAFEMAGSRLSPRMVEWLTAGLGRPPRMGFVSADYEMVAKVMSLSDMFALMSRGFAEELRRHWPLALLDVTLPPYLHEVHVVSRTPLRPRSAVAVVHAILCEALARDETRQLEVDDRQDRKG